MTKQRQEVILFILVLLILIFVGLNSGRYFLRADMTENKIYSISKVSKNLFTEIEEEVVITYYLSERLDKLTPLTGQVKDLLYEYAAFSRGKIKVDVIDPAKAGISRDVESLGIRPWQISVVEENEQSVAVVYSGVVIRFLDRYHTIPLVTDITVLEYELTSSIRNLVQDREKVLGFVIGDDGLSSDDLRYFQNSVGRSFTVREIPRGESIGNDVTVLFVLGNADLDEFDLYPIDQYIMRGGKAFFAVDGVRVDWRGAMTARKMANNPCLAMLAGYGIEVQPKLVLGANPLMFPVREQRGQTTLTRYEPYPHWFQILESQASRDNPITSRFSGLELFWPSPLKLAENGTEVLISSSPDSWLMDENLNIDPRQAPIFQLNRAQSTGSYPLAAAVVGACTSYFAERELPSREGVETDWTDPIGAIESSRIVVLGDSEFAVDLFMQNFGNPQNSTSLLLNGAEWLANDDDLLAIKTRATRDMRLNTIQDPNKKKALILFAEILNIYIVPLFVIAFGVIRLIRRRSKAMAKLSRGGEA